MIKRIIFDVDNTLIPWEKEYDQAIVKAYKDFNININEEELKDFILVLHAYENTHSNFNRKLMMNYFNKNYKHGMPLGYIDRWLFHLKTMTPSDNALLVSTLEYLSKKYSLVVLTNWYHEGQADRLNNMDILKYFDHIYGGEKYMKPIKEAFVLAQGDYDASECVMIGDNIEIDLSVPKSMGMRTILVTNKDIEYEEKIDDINKLKEML